MQIFLHITPPAPNLRPEFLQEIATAVCQAADTIGVSYSALDRIIFADDECYPGAIACIDPSETFTNSGGLIGVGKTISLLQPSGPPISSMVLHINVLTSVVNQCRNRTTIDNPPRTQNIFAYVLFHELGHCRDAIQRPSGIGASATFTGSQNLHYRSAYYKSIALSEYAACRHSSSVVSETLLREMFQHDVATLTTALVQTINNYSIFPNASSKTRASTEYCDVFWLILIQAAKLFGAIDGNPTFTTVALPWSEWAPLSPISLLNKYQFELRKAWELYPNCEVEFFQTCQRAWESLASYHGFSFSPTGAGKLSRTYSS